MFFETNFFIILCTCFCMPCYGMNEKEGDNLTPRTRLDREELQLFKMNRKSVKVVNFKTKDDSDLIEYISVYKEFKREMKQNRIKKVRVHSDENIVLDPNMCQSED